MTISNKETALLGLLSEGAMHAYKIEQEIKNRAMRDWTEISMSSVYKLLRKLEKEKLIKSEMKVSQKNISQKVYSLTSDGKKKLKEKIKILISEPEKTLSRIDLATSHLDQLTKKEAIECLKKYEKRLNEMLACYKELEKYLQGCSSQKHVRALARRPQYLIIGELNWIKEYQKDLK
ncbi:MAG: helix-turn-helix transcriptional regulator [Candidatus Nanoarchaeia archaeon]|nr:helix-turn-helix transcriptional regulator [Candidatus Nanoarchaeia archaeon]MDD5357902.1 helix-turn-helix transcriptional regulator [Candidatus Nanoarchaeia archaeon]MDD5588821.1 helix-turn-helix transcriptional regulator [Candidatus Nanoarchaeia archaeon]